jgi:LPXTG-site transpeptidase (sortase) family protein
MKKEKLSNFLDFLLPIILKMSLFFGVVYFLFFLFFSAFLKIFFSPPIFAQDFSFNQVKENSVGEEIKETQPQKEKLNFERVESLRDDKVQIIEDSLFIPSLGVKAPLVEVASFEPKDFREPLKRGVALYPSSLPGKKGRTIILGHSAPPSFPKINYDWVFSDLAKLKEGDEILINFNQKQYRYLVKGKKILKKGEPLTDFSDNSFSELVLISCWPPGIDYKRLAVFADLVLNNKR